MRLLWCALLLGATSLAGAQKLPWQGRMVGASIETKAPQHVQYLFPEQISVAAGKDAVIEMHFRVNPGMHINSHTPREKWLIATRLNVVETPAMKIGAVDFPAGEDYALASMPNDKLSVYTGEFVVRVHIVSGPGQHILQGALRYQACDANSCYPPREAPVAVDVIAK